MPRAVVSKPNKSDRVVNGPTEEDERWERVVNGPSEGDEKTDPVA